MSDLKARLLSNRLGEKTIDIEGVGEVRVRGLSRAEVLLVSKSGGNAELLERKILHHGVVDPQVSEKDVAVLQKNAPSGDLEKLVDAINELSGLGQGAQKSDVPGTGDES